MKHTKVKFNNVWNDENPYGFDIVNFHIPKEYNVDVAKEYQILCNCQQILNLYDVNNEEELQDALDAYKYDDITKQDLDYAIEVLGLDGACGIITERFVDFIKLKYPDMEYDYPQDDYDLEIDID